MKKTIMNLALMVIAVSAFAQTPDWQWATQAGGDSEDQGLGIAIDDDENSYVTGMFYDVAFFGSNYLASSGASDIFVAKMDANGNWLWATKAGGSDVHHCNGIVIDDDRNSYVTGRFVGSTTFGSYSLTSSGQNDIFVAKMDANGNWLWATKAGGTDWDYGYAIAIDDNGNSYVTGCFTGTANFGSYSITSTSGHNDIFVAKMDSDGNWLWAESAGGSQNDGGYGIAIDDDRNSYLTGYFKDTANFGSYSLTSSGDYDNFVAKMGANGNWLWASQAGGSSGDGGNAIATDDNGNSYVTGWFRDTATFGPYSITSIMNKDIFVAKIDANGNWLWATQAGGGSDESGKAIATDDNGNSYVTGSYRVTAMFGSISLPNSGDDDIFVAKMDTNGNWLWVAQAGGSGEDNGKAIVLDNDGNSYVTGHFTETATFGSYSTTGVEWDIFVAKLGNDTSVESGIIPTKTVLSNYPNPFNPSTTISFEFNNEITENTELVIYNLKGQRIKQFSIFNNQSSISWNGKDNNGIDVSSGVYFYKLNVNGKTEAVNKCLLLK